MSKVFISYSHDNPAHSGRVLALAYALRSKGQDVELDQFHSHEIVDWPRWCNEHISRDGSDFVLCVCTDEYKRRIEGKVPPEKGKGVYWEGSLIDDELYDGKGNRRFLPVLFDATPETAIPRMLRGWTFCRLREFTLDDPGYETLLRVLTGQAVAVKNPVGDTPILPPKSAKPRPPDIAPSRLSHGAAFLLGRDAELARLDEAWDDKAIHLFCIVAWGGTGKTSLAVEWLNRFAARGWPGCQRVFDWSFYSQGSRDTATASADSFISAALRFFGDAALADSPASPWDKGARLAQLVAQQPSLLVLDGLEPLQYPPGPLTGQLKDPALAALLKGLARQNPGLCLVTTREPVAELAPYQNTTAPSLDLPRLSGPSGVKLLQTLGVNGPPAELRCLVEDVQGHALTLSLLGRFLAKAHHGDIRRRDRVKLDKAAERLRDGHVFHVMDAYQHWLAGSGEAGARCLAVLRLLGLFDRPATQAQLAALRAAPAIPGLTEALQDLDEEEWNLILSDLAALGLLPAADKPVDASSSGSHALRGNLDDPRCGSVAQRATTAFPRGAWERENSERGAGEREAALLPSPSGRGVGGEGALDAHPLIREYFARKLREQAADAWRDAHQRVYRYLCQSVEHRPDSVERLQALYQAVYHGCQAGWVEEARAEVYWDRILRGDEFYSSRKLGAVSANLAAVACFFSQPWKRFLPGLTEANQSWLLSVAAYYLRALGRLAEALEPMRTSMEMAVRQEDWTNAAIRASNLSELELALGEIPAALDDAEQAVDYADRSGNWSQRMGKRETWADALQQAGQPRTAAEQFREAERLQAEFQPQYRWLYSLGGFRYCDWLLADAERGAWRLWLWDAPSSGADGRLLKTCQQVEQRATQTLEWVRPHNFLLDIGLDHLSLGRAALYRAMLAPPEPAAGDLIPAGTPESRQHLDAALDFLRRSGSQDHVPRALLTRAWLHVLENQAEAAAALLDEAEEIAERGPMRLHLADVCLHRARLFNDRNALAQARELIRQTGYNRRLAELADAEAAIKECKIYLAPGASP